MRPANTQRTERSRKLRLNATKAELLLWNKLRSRTLFDKFVRQEPVGPFTVDFICRKKKLIVEVDGGQHASNPADIARDQWLAARGYRILRFWNHDVLGNIDGVLQIIAAALAETPPHPDR